MKIIFAGTPNFAEPSLQALLDSQHSVIAVYTQPDRPAGRGRKLTPSPIKRLSVAAGIPVFQPLSLRNQAEQQQLHNLQADAMVVVAYGLILPEAVLTAPRFGCINVHASLLPRWRGAAPIQRAILAGDSETGITIMQMDQGLDTGAMLKQVVCPIGAQATSESLHHELANLGAEALLTVLEEASLNCLRPTPQDNAQACYAAKIEKAEAKIDWQMAATRIDRLVRAFNPWPVAFTRLGGEMIRLWRVKPLPQHADKPAGMILKIDKNSLDVATGEGVIKILELQLAGGRRMLVADFLNAHRNLVQPGQILE